MKKYLQRFLVIAVGISSLLYLTPQLTFAEASPEVYSFTGSKNAAKDMGGLGGSGAGKAFFNAASAGGKTASHSSTSSVNKLPRIGNEYSSVDLIFGGKLKQRRYYGAEGKAYKDIDYFHPGEKTHTFPHIHTWKWNGNSSDRSRH
jgi:hypothetical protein